MKKLTQLIVFILALCGVAHAQQSVLQRNFPIVDGVVNKILVDSVNNRLYLGGNFLGVGQNIKNGTLVDSINSKGTIHNYEPNAAVYQAIADGNNGWYLAGAFTKLGDSTRLHIAHIDSNGKPTQKFSGIGFNAPVNDIKLVGDTLIAIGDFTTFGKQYLTSAGSINNNGENYSEFPETNGYYNCTVADGNGGWFLGGSFTKVGNVARKNLAHINAQGLVSDWSPVTNDVVFTIAVHDNQVFVGGMFTEVNGVAKNKVAAINKINASLTAWNVDLTLVSQVNKLRVINTKLYIIYNEIGGYGKIRRTDLLAGNLDAWDPQPSGATIGIRQLATAGNILFIAGRFNTLGGVNIKDIAAYNLTTDALITSWQVAVNFTTSLKSITDLQVFNNNLYIAGGFSSINGQARNYLAAVNILNAQLTTWNPNPNAAITSMEIADSALYVSGTFTNIGGAAVNNFAKINWETAQLKPWVFYTNTTGRLQSNGNKISVLFSTRPTLLSTTLQLQNYIAGINTSTGDLINWNPNPNANVNCMEVVNNTLYVGGAFTQINGLARNRIAAINLNNGTINSWNPDANNAVYAISATENAIYVGGDFTAIGGQSRTKLAELNKLTGVAQLLNVNINNTVKNIFVDGLYLYLNGSFTSVAGASRYGFACIDVTGVLTSQIKSATNKVIKTDGKIIVLSTGSSGNSFVALSELNNASTNGANGTVYTVCKSGSKYYVGGNFSMFNANAKPYLAACNLTTGEYIPWSIIVSSGQVTSMALEGDNLFVAGGFTSVYSPNGSKSSNFVKINWRTETVSSNWAGNVGGGNVVDIVPYAGKLYVGGLFTNIGGRAIANLAELDTADVVGIAPTATTWNPAANNAVNSLHVAGNILYVGGSFGIIGGQLRSRLAAVNRISGLATNWNPIVNGNVNKIIPFNETLVVGGAFNQIGGQPRSFLAAVDTATAAVTNWNPNLNDVVTSIAQVNNEVWVGGVFTTVGGQSYNNIIGLNPITGTASQYGIFSAKVNTLASAYNRKLLVATSPTLSSVSDGKNYVQYFGGFNIGCYGLNPLSIDRSTQAITCLGTALKLTTPLGRTNYQWYRNNTPLSNANDTVLIVTQPGYYQVKSIDMSGCTDTSIMMQVSYLPLPILPNIVGKNTVLVNSTSAYTITPNTSSTYKWNVQNGILNGPDNNMSCMFVWPNVGKAYVGLTETNQSGCIDSAKFEVTVTSDTVLKIIDTLHINSFAQTLNLAVQANVNWTAQVNVPWANITYTSDSVVVTVTENQSLQFRFAQVRIKAGNKEAVSILVQDGKTNGLAESKISNVCLYPNPSTGNFTLENPSAQAIQVQVYDVLGKQYLDETMPAKSNQGFKMDAQPGVYFVKLSTPQSQQIIKLVVQ